MASSGKSITATTVKKLEYIFGVTHASLLTDDEWDDLIFVLACLKLVIEKYEYANLTVKSLTLHEKK